MSFNVYTFEELIGWYCRLLSLNPGKALVINANTVALLDPSGSARRANFNPRSGVIDRCTQFPFNARAFHDGHWDGEGLEETLAAIESPKFINLVFLPSGPDPLLSGLPEKLLRFVETTLSNDEQSSDDELHVLFTANGLTDAQATRALDFRGRYARYLYRTGDTPILKGDDARHFDSTASAFVRDGG